MDPVFFSAFFATLAPFAFLLASLALPLPFFLASCVFLALFFLLAYTFFFATSFFCLLAALAFFDLGFLVGILGFLTTFLGLGRALLTTGFLFAGRPPLAFFLAPLFF